MSTRDSNEITQMPATLNGSSMTSSRLSANTGFDAPAATQPTVDDDAILGTRV
jgi:hypothetical protein